MVLCSGDRVINLRVRQGMTQEKLAAMSNVSIRTVQRAEKGERLQLETVASLAAALRVTVPELSIADAADEDAPELDHRDEDDRERNAVVLRRITSGKVLLDIVCDSFSGNLYCQVEPTAGNIEALSTMVEQIEDLIPKPWGTLKESVPTSLAERLRVAVTLTGKLEALEEFDVAVFAGTYTVLTRIPYYDTNGHAHIASNLPLEPVTICQVMLERPTQNRVVVKVTDKWVQPALANSEGTNDVPF